jgi:predicted DNA-binding mobile mystery protein A
MKKTTRSAYLRQLDKQLARFRDLPVIPAGYIRVIREALGMNITQLAARMGIAHTSLSDIERTESEQTIALKTLKKAADALDCDLVYALVPRTSLAQNILKQARAKAATEASGVFHSMGLEQQSTEKDEQNELIEERAQELIQKGGRELWA